MKPIEIYQVDAFADKLFSGNPAAVCLFDTWPEDQLMQSIAAENNLAETAFVIPHEDEYAIRWFTPICEVALCGHATLAAAHVLIHEKGVTAPFAFQSRYSGKLNISLSDGEIQLDFPADSIAECSAPEGLAEALGIQPSRIFKGATDFMLIYDTEEEIKQCRPNFHLLHGVDARGIIITAPGNQVDFVSRFFAPQVGVDEDPVTGSAHTTLTPYWAEALGKTHLKAAQLSDRGGLLTCSLDGDRVRISGKSKLYLKGRIYI